MMLRKKLRIVYAYSGEDMLIIDTTKWCFNNNFRESNFNLFLSFLKIGSAVDNDNICNVSIW